MSDAIVVIGAEGMIGEALLQRLHDRGQRVYGTTRRRERLTNDLLYLDLRDDLSCWTCPKQTQVVFFCAGVTSLAACEKFPDESFDVNVRKTVALIKKFTAMGIFVVFPSTNLVFDGNISRRAADDIPCPQTAYGRHKAEVERRILPLSPNVAIVRLTKVLGPTMPLFQEWIDHLKQGRIIHPFANKVMAPVPLAFAVDALIGIGCGKHSGLFQVSSDCDISYADIAYYFADRLGVSSDLVQPIEANTTDRGQNPSHTTLDTASLRTTLGLVSPPVWGVLSDYCDSSAMNSSHL
ncbi:MAG: sugar nucleotide-binding protein [Armatimonadota bacterium]